MRPESPPGLRKDVPVGVDISLPVQSYSPSVNESPFLKVEYLEKFFKRKEMLVDHVA